MSKITVNTLTCLVCNAVLEAPKKDREIVQCKCKNKAWIQKRPDGDYWAYGSLNPILNERKIERLTNG
jgi:hypothetical protein